MRTGLVDLDGTREVLGPVEGAVRPDASGLPPPVFQQLPRKDVVTVLWGVFMSMFLAAINQTIVAAALPTIGRHLADFENLSWVITAYLLTSTAVAPLYGKLADIHGRRAVMLVGIGIFLAGSALCAVAPNMLVLIVGRGLQGVGGGGLLPLTQIIIADVMLPRERGRYQAYIGCLSSPIREPSFSTRFPTSVPISRLSCSESFKSANL